MTQTSLLKRDIIRHVANKRIKFPVEIVDIPGAILTHAQRAAAMDAALASLAAEGRLIRGKYLGCPPVKALRAPKKR